MASGSIFASQFQPVHVAPGRALASFAVNPAIASSTLSPEYSSATSATEAALGTEKRDAERSSRSTGGGGGVGAKHRPAVARHATAASHASLRRQVPCGPTVLILVLNLDLLRRRQLAGHDHHED